MSGAPSLAVALLLAHAILAGAQTPQPTVIAPTPTPVRFSPAIRGEPDPLAADSSLGVFQSKRTAGTALLVVAMPGARAKLSDRATLVRALGDCPGATLPDALPFAAFDSAASDPDLVLVAARARAPDFAGCPGASAPTTIASGVEWVGPAHRWVFPPALLDASITRGEKRVRPVYFGRRPTAIAGAAIADSAGRATGPHDLRIYLHLRDLFFGPAPTRDLRFWLLTRDGSWTPTVVVPHEWIDSVWRASLPSRVARFGERPRAVPSLPRLVPPSEPSLRAALAAYRSGDDGASGHDAAALLATSRDEWLRPENLRFAHLLVGSVLVAHGDSIGGRAEYAAALRSAPCLTLAPGTPEAFTATLESARPEVRCRRISAASLLGRGALFPGGTQARRGQPRTAGFVFGVTAAALATAYLEHAHATRLDQTYLATTDYTRLLRLRHSANSANSIAAGALATGASVWVGSAVWGVLRERVWARRTDHERSYGIRAEAAGR